MAKIATTTPAPAGVNAPAHVAVERRAPHAHPIGGATDRRVPSRRALGQGLLAALAGAGVAALYLSPDPDWSEPHAAAGVGTTPTPLPHPDAELLAAIAHASTNYAAGKAAQTRSYGDFLDWIRARSSEVVGLDVFIAATPARTAEGRRAKAAYALRDHDPAQPEGGFRGVYAVAFSALHDLATAAGVS